MNNPTKEQEDIYAAVKSGEESLLVQAGPGCGKTSTALYTMEAGRPGYRMALAFNKTIATEMAHRAPSSVTVQTSHASGLAMLKSRFRSQVNPRSPWSKESKAYKVIQRVFPSKFSDKFGEIAAMMTRGMDQLGYGADEEAGTSPSEWVEILLDSTFENNERTQIAERLPRALDEYCQETATVSFADMLILPLRYNLEPHFPQTQLWVDEFQDWSPTQIALAAKHVGPHTLVYGFGDDFQSIYAFRGADIHAGRRFMEAFNCKTMPLTQSFRCPQAVIELAKRRNPNLRARLDAPMGVIRHLDDKIKWTDITPDPTDTMVICRYNGPLFSVGLRFLAEGHPVRVSSNLPNALKQIIRSLKTDDMTLFKERLEEWFSSQLEFAGENTGLQGQVAEKYGALVSLFTHSDSVPDMLANIDRLTRGSEGPLLSTVHKAKGLEAQRVILLESRALLPPGQVDPRYADDQVGLEQEWNCWFVAVTRSKHDLYFA